MFMPRRLLPPAMVLAVILGLVALTAPARADSVAATIDDFSSASAGSLGPRAVTLGTDAAFTSSGGVGTATTVAENGSSVTLTYTFGSPQSLAVAGRTLRIDFSSISWTGTDLTAANVGVSLTDTSGRSTGTSTGIGPVSSPSGVAFDATNFSGNADLSAIASLVVTVAPPTNVGGGRTTVKLTDIRLADSGGQQTIDFGGAPAATSIGSTYTPVATASSGLAVGFSVDAATTNGACTLSGGVVTFHHAGTCVVDANQTGSAEWAPAPQVQQSIVVRKSDQQLNISALPTANAVVAGSGSFTATDTAGTSVTYASQTPSVCSVSGATVTFLHAAECIVRITGAADSDHNAVTQDYQVVVAKADQSIAVSGSFVDAMVGQTRTITATGSGSGLPAAVAVSTGTTNGACTVSGSTVSLVHTGMCVLSLSGAGNSDYEAAAAVTRAITVGPASSAPAVTSAAPTGAKVGGSYAVTTSTGTPDAGPVVLSIGSGTTNDACAIDGSAVSFAHAGQCDLLARQEGNADYAPGQAEQSFTIGTAAQTIVFTSTAPAAPVVGESYTVAASGGLTGNPVTFSTTSTACSVSGATVSFVHAGSCVIAADQSGSADYAAATTATQSITVGKAAQAITWISQPPATAYVGRSYALSGTGGASGNPVVFASTTPAVCSVSGTTATFLTAGTCTLAADQAGDADYQAAPQVPQDVVVTQVPSTMTVGFDVAAPVFGQPVRATATVVPAVGSAAGSVQFAVDGTVVGSPVELAADGTATSAVLGDLAVADHDVTAAFVPGDAVTYASASGQGAVAVGRAATTTSVKVDAGHLTAAVRPVSPGAGQPSGSVTFLLDGAQVGHATLDHGVATLGRAIPAGAAHAVGATYAGDDSFTASSGSTARTDPTIGATVTAAASKTRFGWYRSAVTVRFTCAARGAALSVRCPSPVTLSRNGAAQSVSRTIAAVDGGVATVTVSPINIDRSAPKVRLRGVRKGETFDGRAPKATCVGRDALSGLASCRVNRATHGQRVTYTATATDKAGNTARSRVRVKVATVAIAGVPFRHGAYVVHGGHTYTLTVVSGSRPRYVDAAPYPRRPTGLDNYLHRAGSVGGTPRWTIGVTFAGGMTRHGYWNVGVLDARGLHVLKVRVLG